MQAFQMMKGVTVCASKLRPHRAHAAPLGVENGTAQRAQTVVAVDRALHARPARLRGQQAATQGTVDRHAKLKLASGQVDADFLAGKQVELFVRLDQLVGIKGPGRARHRGLSKRGAQP